MPVGVHERVVGRVRVVDGEPADAVVRVRRVGAGVVDVDELVGRVVRVERDAEHAALALGPQARRSRGWRRGRRSCCRRGTASPPPPCSSTQRSPLGAISIAVALDRPVATAASVNPVRQRGRGGAVFELLHAESGARVGDAVRVWRIGCSCGRDVRTNRHRMEPVQRTEDSEAGRRRRAWAGRFGQRGFRAALRLQEEECSRLMMSRKGMGQKVRTVREGAKTMSISASIKFQASRMLHAGMQQLCNLHANCILH